jgi:hypothetical protein
MSPRDDEILLDPRQDGKIEKALRLDQPLFVFTKERRIGKDMLEKHLEVFF